MPYEPIVPEGQHLGTSHHVDGAVVGHLFDDETNELKGHAAWRLVDEPEEDSSSRFDDGGPRELTPEERELVEKLAQLILAGLVLAVIAATPHLRRVWNEKAVPTLKSAWKRVRSPRKAKSEIAAAASSSTGPAAFVPSPAEVEVAEASGISMTRAEWEQRFRAALAAGAFTAEQLRILFNARIEDDDALEEATSPTNLLTPQQFGKRIELMLAANPSLLAGETPAELLKVFGAPPEAARPPGLEQ